MGLEAGLHQGMEQGLAQLAVVFDEEDANASTHGNPFLAGHSLARPILSLS